MVPAELEELEMVLALVELEELDDVEADELDELDGAAAEDRDELDVSEEDPPQAVSVAAGRPRARTRANAR